MTEEKCIIHKVSVEVNAFASMDTDTLQKEVHRLVEEAVLKQVDVYLTRKSAQLGQQALRIDRLDLNLDLNSLAGSGRMEAERHIEAQLDRFFYALNLEEAQARLSVQPEEVKRSEKAQAKKQMLPWQKPEARLAGSSSNGIPVELRTQIERKYETLLHFLKEGTAPWWVQSAEEMRSIVKDEVLVELLEESIIFRQQIRQYLKRPRFFERLTLQFTPTTVARAILFIANEQWPDMVSFQKSYLAPLEGLKQLTRTERTEFWRNFYKGSLIQSLPQWKEKIVLESFRSFQDRSQERFALVAPLAAKRLHVPAEIAALTVAMLSFKGKQQVDLAAAWTALLEEIPEDLRGLMTSPSKPVAPKKLRGKSGKEIEQADAAASDPSNMDSKIEKRPTAPKASHEIEKDSDSVLAERFAHYRRRMETRQKRAEEKKGVKSTAKDDPAYLSDDPDEVWKNATPDAMTENNYDAREESTTNADGQIMGQAGILLIHPFLKAFCKRWELLTESDELKSPEEMVHILHFMATGRENDAEFELSMEKFLCGLDADTVLEKESTITDEMKENVEELLQSAITHWTALKGTSVAALRGEFLMRPGKVEVGENHISVTMERKVVDILIDKLPWTLNYIKLPWRKELIRVTW
jgi:hypothetical protein